MHLIRILLAAVFGLVCGMGLMASVQLREWYLAALFAIALAAGLTYMAVVGHVCPLVLS